MILPPCVALTKKQPTIEAMIETAAQHQRVDDRALRAVALQHQRAQQHRGDDVTA